MRGEERRDKREWRERWERKMRRAGKDRVRKKGSLHIKFTLIRSRRIRKLPLSKEKMKGERVCRDDREKYRRRRIEIEGDNVLARKEKKDARKSQGRLHIQLSQRSSIRIGEEVDKTEKGQIKKVGDSIR